MALQPTRVEYRIALSNVDRGRTLDEPLIAQLHPSETTEHLTLRVLAWCLLNEEGLSFGPGLSTPDSADLWTRDLTGRITTWVECGTADGAAVRKIAQHHPGVALHAVFAQPRRRDELVAGLASWKRAAEVALWTLDAELVSSLTARAERRQRWAVTVVGDHLYVEADGHALDGAATRSAVSAAHP